MPLLVGARGIMLNKKVCKACVMEFETRGGTVYTLEIIEKRFEEGWNRGFVKCPGLIRADIAMLASVAENVPEDCSYIAEQVVS